MEFNTDFITNAPVGAELLSKRSPGWAYAVDLPSFRINDIRHCILAQLHGDYYEGRRVLFGDDMMTVIIASGDHGFAPLGLADTYEQMRLEAEWEYIIRELRS